MTAAQRKALEKRLLALIAELSGKTPARIEPNRTSDEQSGGDEDAQPLNEMMQAIASNRNRTQGGVLVKAQKALGKLRDAPDEFGLCEECEEEIAMPRLTAMPYAELCVDCQASRDGNKGPATRRKLTDYR